MPSERLQTAFFTQFPPFSIIPNNTVILKPVISAQMICCPSTQNKNKAATY
ncbi:hypothetical protein [Neisseria meningitidis]|uniref:hypothetical protein n=1 Tax=Neisseria meningitidis TaxID=487 RepID=UPI000A67144B|nr:hypothetical protein [Neisseria meningitidis]